MDSRTTIVPGTAQEIVLSANQLADRLRIGLLAVATESAGPAYRPSRMVENLGIDKSLASRIARSLRSDSATELLHLIPSPTGLNIFLDAAARRRTSPEAMRRAREAVAAFHEFLGGVPGGRTGLEALMSESAVEVRERAERAATQNVHRSMSYLLGFRCETMTSAAILQPSANGEMVDSFEMVRREGIRRLRPSAPVALFSIGLVPPSDPTSDAPYVEPLRPGVDPSDATSVLLPEFCEPTPPAIELLHNERHTIYALSNRNDSVRESVTISSAYVVRNGFLRWRRNDQDEEARTYLLHYPCKLLIRDVFIRDDLYPGIEPQVRLEFPGPPGVPRPHSSNPAVRLNQLDLSTPVVSLGRGLRQAGAAGASQHLRMLEHTFRMAGLDPERFRGYRTRVMYPVPMITMAWWFPLPSKP